MTVLFYIAAVVAVAATLLVVTRTNLVHALLYLVVSLFAVAVVFYSLGAPFVAALEVIVYAGAIMVLFIYTVMLLNLNIQGEFPKSRMAKIASAIAGASLLLVLVAVFRSYDLKMIADPALNQIGLVKNLGKVLFEDYYLPFELSSILFLAAMVGAVMLGKKNIS